MKAPTQVLNKGHTHERNAEKVKYVRTSVLKHGENVGFAADPDVS